MKRNTYGSAALVALLIAALLAAFSSDTLAENVQPRNYKTKALMNKGNAEGWNNVATKCTTTPVSDECAQAAIVETTTECGADAQLFTKDVKVWKIIGFAMVAASAAFTGVGASATIANAKKYSTLGGTTGLGAVTTNINSNVTTDQGGLTALNTVLTNFLTYVQTGGTNKAAPDNASIYKSAPIYAAQCAAAANASSASK